MLEPILNVSYTLKHTKFFCHCVGSKGYKQFSKNMNSDDILKQCIFVGVINIPDFGERQVFYRPNNTTRRYVMFSNDSNKHIIRKD